MLQTPERHKILAAAAARMAENLEACARNPRLAEWERARYAELARVERLHQAYHEEAAKLREQGLTPPDWIEMSGAFTRQGKADPNHAGIGRHCKQPGGAPRGSALAGEEEDSV